VAAEDDDNAATVALMVTFIDTNTTVTMEVDNAVGAGVGAFEGRAVFQVGKDVG
jgi:hypothetical protein